jgi:hypothetical protein
MDYLFASFRDLGMVQPAGMGGLSPLLYSEIVAYSELSGGLDYWEKVALRAMSEAFCQGYSIGKDPLGRWPWNPETNTPYIEGNDKDA